MTNGAKIGRWAAFGSAVETTESTSENRSSSDVRLRISGVIACKQGRRGVQTEGSRGEASGVRRPQIRQPSNQNRFEGLPSTANAGRARRAMAAHTSSSSSASSAILATACTIQLFVRSAASRRLRPREPRGWRGRWRSDGGRSPTHLRPGPRPTAGPERRRSSRQDALDILIRTGGRHFPPDEGSERATMIGFHNYSITNHKSAKNQCLGETTSG